MKKVRRNVHTSRNIIKHEIVDGVRKTTAIPVPLETPRVLPAVAQLFEHAFATAPNELQFQDDWMGATGYLEPMLREEGIRQVLPMGERASFVDSHGRRGLAMHTTLGLAVVFERYSDGPVPLVSCLDLRLAPRLQDSFEIYGALKFELLQALLLLTQISAHYERVEAHAV